MEKYGIFSVSQFARLAKITRDIVLNYDKQKLIKPATRDKNYRYYSSDQLAVANLIRMHLKQGMSLATIKELIEQRTPENVSVILENQVGLLDAQIKELEETKEFVVTYNRIINSVRNVNEQEIKVQFLPEVTIMLGNIIEYSGSRNEYDGLKDFYTDMTNAYPNANLNYPVWAIFSKERIKIRDSTYPDRYFSYNPRGMDKRPAALYAIGYTRGGYGQAYDLYSRLLAYIEQNGFEVCGDTYEEYPLNEVCISDEANYLIKVMITVCEKK
jgi:DNA-binding transcriptional MerR regulator